MNYIIKGVLKKIFTQYLYIQNQGLDLQSGIIRLPHGNINHQRINDKLKILGIKVNTSSYKNLIIHVPIIEIMSKPIRISIQVLDVVIEKLQTSDKQRKQSSSSVQSKSSHKADKEKTKQQPKQPAQQKNNSYIRNIINRLLYNMQIFMEKINIKLIDRQAEEEFREAFFTLNSMNLKNSLIILEANIVKKTFTLNQLHLKHTIGQIIVKDLNVCLDFNNKRVSIIAVVGNVGLDLFKIPFKIINQLINAQKQQKAPVVDQKIGNLLQLSFYAKITSSNFVIAKLLKLQSSSIELKYSKSRECSEVSATFTRMKVKNYEANRQDQNLIDISYLPFSKEVKINVEYQDSIIKHSFLAFKKQLQTVGEIINAKICHLSISINVDHIKILLDNLIKRAKELDKIKRILVKLKDKKVVQQTPSEPESADISIHFLAYRVRLEVNYGSINTKIFGTALLNKNQQKTLKKRKSNERNKNGTQASKKDSTIKLKIYQLGGKVLNYSIVELSQFDIQLSKKQLVINGSSLCSQVSLSLFHNLTAQSHTAIRDIAYYKDKFKGLIGDDNIKHPKEDSSQLQEVQQKQEINALANKPAQKLFLKINEVVLSLGEMTSQLIRESADPKSKMRQQHIFIAIVEIELTDNTISLIDSKLKYSSDLIAFISSPYTLERTPLSNELQLSLHHNTQTQELSISFRNNLVLLVQDHYFHIIYKLMDKQDIWCSIRNLTHQKISIQQQTHEHIQLVQNDQRQGDLKGDELFYLLTQVQPAKSKHLFWINDQGFKLIIGKRKTSLVCLSSMEQLSSNSMLSHLQIQKQFIFSQESENEYLLKFLYNKLGNLCEIVLDYKLHIASYSKDFTVKIGNCQHLIKRDRQSVLCQRGQWFQELQDMVQDYLQYSLSSQGKKYNMQHLLTNDLLTLLGIYQTIQRQSQTKTIKLYDSYILKKKFKKQVFFSIMPLMIITNNCTMLLQLQITDKKSQQKEKILLKSNECLQFGNNGKFDYYMKQFTIKLSMLNETTKTVFESESFYFNTFFMVDHKIQTQIQLRSNQKNDYSKRALIFQEAFLLKTKTIIIKNAIRINNSSDFSFIFRVKDSIKYGLGEEAQIESNSMKDWNFRLKQDTVIQVLMNKQVQSKVEIRYGDIRQLKILSFNFCKIKERFFNLLVRIESRYLDGIQTIFIDHFIEIINLCQFIPELYIQDTIKLKYQQRAYLPLNSTSLNKYNNKIVSLDDLNKIYAEIFLTAKVTDYPLTIFLGQNAIPFEQFIKNSNQELQVGKDRLIFTLLKDMNSSRITFYLTDKLYNQKLHYTVFNNESTQHFLLTDDTQYAHHFMSNDSLRSFPPEKIYIDESSFNCLINRENYDILLCDSYQKHLEKMNKAILEKQSIKIQHYNFDAITLIDCCNETSESVRKQLTTKNIEIRIKMFKKIQLSLGIQALTVRLLEKNKLDCLIQDISIRNQETKDNLLRVPEETYLLIEGRVLHDRHFLLVKNLFIKCKNVIVNIRRQMPYSLIHLISNISERLGINVPLELETLEPRKYREQIKKQNGQAKLRRYIGEDLLLLRNVFIHEIHLSLTIELENLSFSNVIILPSFQVINKFEKGKHFTDSIVTFYLSNLLAKFPKLSFLLSNFKNPINTLRLFFNLREALKQKTQYAPLIDLNHSLIPDNPFLFSVQRWNLIHKRLVKDADQPKDNGERLIGFLFETKRYLMLTNVHLILVQEGSRKQLKLKQLQSVRIIKNRLHSQLILTFHSDKIFLVEQHKKCLQMLKNIEKLLL